MPIPSFTQTLTPIKKTTFFDYFGYTSMRYPGYVKQDTFRLKMANVIQRAINNQSKTGSFLRLLYGVENNKVPQGYYEKLKKDILNQVLSEEWRSIEKLNMSAKYFETSNKYYTSAATDVGLAVVTANFGKGFTKLAEKMKWKPKATTIQYPNKASNKGISFSRTIDTLESNGMKYNQSFKLSYVGKKSNWGREVSFTKIGKKAKPTVDIFEIDIVSLNRDIWSYNAKTLYKLNSKDNASDFESFNCFDFGFETEWAKKLNSGADIITDLIPLISLPKLVVNTGYNLLLGYQTRSIANSIKEMEDRNEQLQRDFQNNLRHAIVSDIRLLSDTELKELINLLKIKELQICK